MAYAQQNDPQGFGPRGNNGPEAKPEGMGAPGMMRRGHGPEGGHGAMIDVERAKQAGATEQQLEALKAFVFEQQVKRIDLQAAVDKAELALERLMKSETMDEKAALKAADALTQARGELFKLGIADRVKVGEILGTEVLKKMHELPPPRMQCPRSGAQDRGNRPGREEGGHPHNPPNPEQGGNPPPQGQDK